MLIAAFFTVVKERSQPACSSTDEWIAKVWVVYVCMLVCAFNKMLFSFKEYAVTNFAWKWMDVEHIILSKVTQSRRKRTACFPSCLETSQYICKQMYMWEQCKMLKREQEISPKY